MSWDSFWNDVGDTISEGASAVTNAVEQAANDLEQAAEDVGQDLQNAWNETTKPITDAAEQGDAFGVVIGVLGAAGMLPIEVGGATVAAGVESSFAITGAGIKVAGGVVGGLVGLGIALGSFGFASGTGRDFGHWMEGWTKTFGDWNVKAGFLLGMVSMRFADIGATLGIYGTRNVQCRTRALTGLGSSGTSTSVHGPFDQVRHFFVLMFENRSFDHMLGRMPGVNGIGGTYNLGTDQATRVYADGIGNDAVDGLVLDIPHEFDNIRRQIQPDAHGNPNGMFIAEFAHAIEDARAKAMLSGGTLAGLTGDYANQVMKSFAPDRIPILTTLAAEFAICENWHASLPGPTVPNRQFVHAATAGGMADSPPDKPNMPWLLSFGGFDYEHGTIYDRLDACCVPWRIY